jgi:hypothetical protein
MATDEEKAAAIALNLENFNKIKDTPIYAKHLNAHGELYHEQNKGGVFKAAQGEAYGHVDKLLFDILEIERKDNTKTTDGLKPILEEYKALKAANGEGNADNTAAIEALKRQHGLDLKGVQDLLSISNEEISTLKGDAVKRDITSSLSKGLRGKKFKANYSTSDIDDLTTIKMAKIVNLSKIENGQKVFYNADGTKRITTGGINMTAQQVIDVDFADMFEAKTPGGDPDPNNKDNNNVNTAASFENDKVTMNMKVIKTRDDFYKAFKANMAKSGIPEHTTKYDKLYKDAMLEYGYDALPKS